MYKCVYINSYHFMQRRTHSIKYIPLRMKNRKMNECIRTDKDLRDGVRAFIINQDSILIVCCEYLYTQVNMPQHIIQNVSKNLKKKNHPPSLKIFLIHIMSIPGYISIDFFMQVPTFLFFVEDFTRIKDIVKF